MNEDHITRLNIDGKEIILLGTAHVSAESAEEVRQLVEEEAPNSICIELDEARYQSMNNPKKWEDTDIVEIIKKKQAFLLLANLILAAYQKRMAQKMGSEVGKEMSTAIALAKEKDIKLVLADRSVQTTFKRIWAKHSLKEKAKIIAALLSTDEAEDSLEAEDIEKLKSGDMLDEALKEISKEFPIVYEVLVEERNKILAYNIRNAPGPKVVAVLGAAHVPGIKEEITKVEDVSALSKVPEKSAKDKWKKWILPAVLLLILIFSFVKNLSTGLAQIKSWFLLKGICAAIGSALCLAHPLSIIAAFLTAPFTAFSPLLAAGFFAGITEAQIRKPKVSDFNSVYEDVSSLKGVLKNRVTKILLIVIVTNLFSSIGTLLGGIDIIKRLFS